MLVDFTLEVFTLADSELEAFTPVVTARVDMVLITIQMSVTTTLTTRLHGLQFMEPLLVRQRLRPIMRTMALGAPMAPIAAPIAHTSTAPPK